MSHWHSTRGRRATPERGAYARTFADAAWDEVVRARAEAAEEHARLLLHLCYMTHAASREARGRGREGCGAGGKGEDELHYCWKA